MKNTNAKMIIIIVSVIVTIIIGTLIYIKLLPKQTQSKQEDLWEYVFKDNFQNIFLSYFNGEDYVEMLNNKKYETTTTISSIQGNLPENEQLSKILPNIEINATSKVNNETSQSNGNIIINYLKNQVFKIDYIKDKQSYGLKSDEVVDRYLGIRNSDLDLLLQKFGIATDIKQLEILNYKDFLPNLQTIELLKQDLKKVISEQIPTDNFKKQTTRKTEVCGNQVTVDSYTLTLSDEQTYQILAKLLEKIGEDEQLIQELNLNEKVLSLFGIENSITKETIQTYIENIKTKEYSGNQMIMVTIYVLDEKMVKLDINITQGEKNSEYIIEALESSNIMNFIINNQENENVNTFEISLSKTENDVYKIGINQKENDEEKLNLVIQANTQGSVESGNVTNLIVTKGKYGKYNLEAKISNTIKILNDIELENLSPENCVFVNDMEKERITTILNSIKERLKVLYNTKMDIIKSGELQKLTKPVNDEVQKHNSEFEIYEGQFTGDIVVELLNKLINSNIASEYKIALKTKLTQDNETNLKETEITVDKLQPLANLLDNTAKYTISLHYQDVSGAIDEITIVKSDLAEEEPPQVTMPSQEEGQAQE